MRIVQPADRWAADHDSSDLSLVSDGPVGADALISRSGPPLAPDRDSPEESVRLPPPRHPDARSRRAMVFPVPAKDNRGRERLPPARLPVPGRRLFPPPSNVAKMKQGIALSSDGRALLRALLAEDRRAADEASRS